MELGGLFDFNSGLISDNIHNCYIMYYWPIDPYDNILIL